LTYCCIVGGGAREESKMYGYKPLTTTRTVKWGNTEQVFMFDVR
jgi:hypothetical protein